MTDLSRLSDMDLQALYGKMGGASPAPPPPPATSTLGQAPAAADLSSSLPTPPPLRLAGEEGRGSGGPDFSQLSDEGLMDLYRAMPAAEAPDLSSSLPTPPPLRRAGEEGRGPTPPPEERSAVGAPQPASALDVVGNALTGAGYALGDIPAGIEQLVSRYLPVPDSYKAGVDARVAEYEAEKKQALEKPGGTTGYVGGQLVTAFAPGTGALKLASNASKVSRVANAARPIAAGTALTAVKPYETEADRGQSVAISAGLGAAIPGATSVVRGIGGQIRPRVPTGKPPGGVPPGPPPAGGAAGSPPVGAPPGGAPPAPPGNGGVGDDFIAKLKAAPESAKKGDLLEAGNRLKVTPTPGQIAGGTPSYLESQMLKLPGSRSVAEKATRESHESYHRALGREMGAEDTPYLTRDVIEAQKAKLSDIYDEILPQAQVTQGTAAAGKLESEAAKLTAPFSDVVAATIKKSSMKELQRIQDGITAGLKTGQISGEELKVLTTRVRELGEDRKLHNAVRDRIAKFKAALTDTLAGSLDETSPELAARLRLNDKHWANASILQKVQTAAGANVEGFVSGPQLLNAIVARHGNPSKVGDFGKLGEMGQMFYRKLPDSGSADRWMANTILTGGLGVGAAGASYSGLLDPSTAIGLMLTPKLAAHAYYQTPGYRNALAAARVLGSGASRTGASGAGRTGQPDDRVH